MVETTPLAGNKPSHTAQYLTGLAATMGALSMGAILGYSSPASVQLAPNITACVDITNCTTDCPLINGEPLTDTQLSWFSSSVNLAAMVGSPLTGVLINKIGRRVTMIISIVPFLIGWILIGTATNFTMLMFGRIFCGLCAGVVCLVVPTYLGEISSAEIRGLLGTGFQLMASVGFLFAYSVGAAVCWQWLALASLLPVVLFVVGIFFSVESPSYLIIKNRQEDARAALTHLRGKKYDIEPELRQMQQAITEAEDNKGSFRDLLLPYNIKPFIISVSLVVFQQFSGANAILFNLSTIFETANTGLSADASSIIVASVQVAATALASVLMDKAGRKLLLLISSAAMILSLVSMGVFFFLKEQGHDISSLDWLPLTSLIVYIAFFSIGFGPIPWVIMGEIFTADVRDLAASLVTTTNWFACFVVTLIFVPLKNALHDSGVYWLFAGLCAVNFVFCLLVVKETKGKTIQEISAMFGGPQNTERHSINLTVNNTL